MIVCPSCGSSRIRNDYKPAPTALRVIGIRALLCDYCNRQFRAFSPTAPKSRAPRQTKRKADVFNQAPEIDLNQIRQTGTRVDQEQAPKITLNRFARTSEPQPVVTGEIIASDQRDLRTEITRIYEESAKQLPGNIAPQQELTSGVSVHCPECGSQDVRQRHRSGLERAVFSISDHKAFTCRACEATFYAKLDEGETEPPLINSPIPR